VYKYSIISLWCKKNSSSSWVVSELTTDWLQVDSLVSCPVSFIGTSILPCLYAVSVIMQHSKGSSYQGVIWLRKFYCEVHALSSFQVSLLPKHNFIIVAVCSGAAMAMNGGEDTSSESDNFWEIDGFRRTVRRTEDGMHQCSELMKMMQERAEIEKDYAKRLRMWCKKWADNTEKGTVVHGLCSTYTCNVQYTHVESCFIGSVWPRLVEHQLHWILLLIQVGTPIGYSLESDVVCCWRDVCNHVCEFNRKKCLKYGFL